MTRRALPALVAGLSLALSATTTAAAAPAPTPDGSSYAGSSAAPPTAPPEFVALRDVDPTIVEEIRYATPHNFMGERVDAYRAPMCLLTRPAAQALARAQAVLRPQGLTLKVYDCYRPQTAVDHFVRWAQDVPDQTMKSEFYPQVDKSRLFEDGYIAEKSGHSRGSTVDLTVQPIAGPPVPAPHAPHPAGSCIGPREQRVPDKSLDMGTSYDCFDVLSHTANPAVTGEQRRNRDLLVNVLAAQGFANYENEWWHFTHQPELFPKTYFDFPVSRASLPKA